MMIKIQKHGGVDAGETDWVEVLINELSIRVDIPLGHSVGDVEVGWTVGGGWTILEGTEQVL